MSKVVFYNPVGFIGGAERVLLLILQSLATETDLELYLIVGTDGALLEEARKLGVEVIQLSLPDRASLLGDSNLKTQGKFQKGIQLFFQGLLALPGLINYLRVLRHCIYQIKPVLVHSNGIKTHLLSAIAVPHRIPIVWHIHDYYHSRPLIAKILEFLSMRAVLGIAVSRSVAEDASLVLPRLPIEVVYNRVQVDKFMPRLESANFPSSLIQIGLVATFARWKGQDIFLQAAAQVLPHYPQCHFHIIGGPIYYTQGSQFSLQELEDLATKLGIRDQVTFRGYQRDIVPIYQSLDIVIHASTQPEPFGLTILEAMACGKPVVVAQGGGAAELFTDQYDAIGVPPGDSYALAQALQLLIQNPQLRQQLGLHARQTVCEKFNRDQLGNQVFALYQRLYIKD